MDKDICKICGRELVITDLFCPECGFERHILPSSISDEVKIYEEEREEKYTVRWEEHTVQEELKEEKMKLSDELKQVKDDLKKMKEFEQNQQRALETKDSEIEHLSEELKQAKEYGSMNVKGIVHIQNISNDEQCYLPVFDGVNTFGTDASNGNHHFISISNRGIGIKGKHFSVETKDGRFILSDLSNGSMTFKGRLISANGVLTDSNAIYKIGDNIIINISSF